MTASATGSDLLIRPTDISKKIPDKGIDVFLGPGLQADLDKILKGVCKNGMSKECTAALSTFLNKDEQFAIEARLIGAVAALGAWAVVGIIGVGIGLYNEKQPNKLDHFHVPSAKFAQMLSQTEKTAVLATATGTSSHITISMTPTPTSASPATVTTLSADKDGHHKGDVIIKLPSRPADLLEQLLAKARAHEQCAPAKSHKRGSGLAPVPNYGEINNLAAWALPMAAPGQLLQALGVQANAQLPHMRGIIPNLTNGPLSTWLTIDNSDCRAGLVGDDAKGGGHYARVQRRRHC